MCVRVCVRVCVCVCIVRQAIIVIKTTIIKFLFAQICVYVVFVIRCLYSAVSLTKRIVLYKNYLLLLLLSCGFRIDHYCV